WPDAREQQELRSSKYLVAFGARNPTAKLHVEVEPDSERFQLATQVPVPEYDHPRPHAPVAKLREGPEHEFRALVHDKASDEHERSVRDCLLSVRLRRWHEEWEPPEPRSVVTPKFGFHEPGSDDRGPVTTEQLRTAPL